MLKERGVLTIAHGAPKYIRMAINLAMSIKVHDPNLPIALVTDSSDPKLSKYFDIIVDIDMSRGKGLVQKLYLLDYSPFEETIFIDADCLAAKSVLPFFDQFTGKSVGAYGQIRSEGTCFSFDVQHVMKTLNLPYAQFVFGGFYYVKRSEEASAIFRFAQSVIPRYEEFGIRQSANQVNDEPLMGLGMSAYHNTAIPWSDSLIRHPMGETIEISLDVLRGRCTFIAEGQRVEPQVIHFLWYKTRSFFYQREILKLKLDRLNIMPRSMASLLVNLITNPVYATVVFFYRLTQTVRKGMPFQFLPLMPYRRFHR